MGRGDAFDTSLNMKITVNNQLREIERHERITVHDLLNALDVTIPNERIHVQINGQEAKPSTWLKQGPKQGDDVRITVD